MQTGFVSRKRMDKLSGNAQESLPTHIFHMISVNPTNKYMRWAPSSFPRTTELQRSQVPPQVHKAQTVLRMQVVLTPKPMPLTTGSQVGTILPACTHPPQRYLAMSPDILIVTAEGREGRWQAVLALMGRGQRCCYTSYNAQKSPHSKQSPSQNVNGTPTEKRCS